MGSRVGRGLLALAMGLVAASGGLAGCGGTSRPEDAPLRVTISPAGPDTRLTLHVAPNLKVNARIVPALELSDRSVVRFETGRLTADSAYFAEPPSALLPGRRDAVHGTLRASVCEVGAQVCRSLDVEI